MQQSEQTDPIGSPRKSPTAKDFPASGPFSLAAPGPRFGARALDLAVIVASCSLGFWGCVRLHFHLFRTADVGQDGVRVASRPVRRWRSTIGISKWTSCAVAMDAVGPPTWSVWIRCGVDGVRNWHRRRAESRLARHRWWDARHLHPLVILTAYPRWFTGPLGIAESGGTDVIAGISGSAMDDGQRRPTFGDCGGCES